MTVVPWGLCPNHQEEPICECGANRRCPHCGFGVGSLPCACTPEIPFVLTPVWEEVYLDPRKMRLELVSAR